MQQYLNLCKKILSEGIAKKDRTNTGTLSIFGHQMRFNLLDGFPLLTTKKVNIRSAIYELLWFIKGDTNTKWLNDNDVHIWDAWADENGNLGPIYGKQWNNQNQLGKIIKMIKKNPDSRRLIVNSWNIHALPKMKLPPCHVLFQFYVNNSSLSLQLYQRSADVFIGLPFNIAEYALLLMMVAQVTNLVPRELIHTIGDAHIYLNHLKQVKLQVCREPKALPTMAINPEVKDIFRFKYEDFTLEDYVHNPFIKGEINV